MANEHSNVVAEKEAQIVTIKLENEGLRQRILNMEGELDRMKALETKLVLLQRKNKLYIQKELRVLWGINTV